MPDDRAGREKQADDEERRQREREVAEARERADEAEPVDDAQDPAEATPDQEPDELGDLDEALAAHAYPVTADELVAAHGDRVVESQGGWRSVEEVLAPAGDETFDSADEVRRRIQGRLDRA